MDTIERVFELMNQNNISQVELQRRLNLSSGLITQWKQGKQKPSTEAIIKIANFFNVTTDYLLGRTENPHFDINDANQSNNIELPNTYLRFAQKAHDLKMSEKDMDILLDFFKRAQERDNPD